MYGFKNIPDYSKKKRIFENILDYSKQKVFKWAE